MAGKKGDMEMTKMGKNNDKQPLIGKDNKVAPGDAPDITIEVCTIYSHNFH